MIRAISYLGMASLVGLAGLLWPGVAGAQPDPPCSFQLTPPQVEQVAGDTVVTATLTPSPCGFPASPRQSVACLQVQGESAQTCTQGRDFGPAKVVLAPYRPGATYVSSGRGCGSWAGNLPALDCQLLGPEVATL